MGITEHAPVDDEGAEGAMMPRNALLSVAVVAVALSAAGCSSPATTADDGTAQVDIAVVPVTGSELFQIADEQGYFADRGIEVEISEVQGPAAIASLQNGEAQFASLGATVAVNAIASGAPISIVGGRTVTTDDPDADSYAIVAMADSGIETAEDLNGRLLATQTLTSQSTLMAQEAIAAEGGDPESIEWVDISFADMMPALRSGSVEAAVVSEPFLTTMQKEGATKIIATGASAFDVQTPVGITAAETTFAEESPEVVEAVNDALSDAMTWIAEDEERYREALPEYVNLTPEQAAAMEMPTFDIAVTEESMSALVDAMRRWEFLTKDVDLSALVPAP